MSEAFEMLLATLPHSEIVRLLFPRAFHGLLLTHLTLETSAQGTLRTWLHTYTPPPTPGALDVYLLRSLEWARGRAYSVESYLAHTGWDDAYQDAGSALLGQWIVIQRSWGGPSADRWFEALLNPKLREAVRQELDGR